MKKWASCISAFVLVLFQVSLLSAKTVNVVSDYGADSTGSTYCTAVIQRAINSCASGDTLLIPAGTYLMNNGLTLKSNITVFLAPGSLVKANTSNVWFNTGSPMFYANGLTNVTITGGGTIDGGGLVYPRGTSYTKPRPGNGIKFNNCTNMTIKNVTVQYIPTFCVDYVNSSALTIDSVTINGRGFNNNAGGSDGMDVEGCFNVAISNCNIQSGDDALCLKSNDVNHPCHDITATNCTLASTCNCFKIGTNTVGDVYNIVANGFTINKHSNPGSGNPTPTSDCIAAICLEDNDHGHVHDVTCENFTVNSCYSPIFIELQNRQSVTSGTIGQLDTITIENFNCLKSVSQPIIFNWQLNQANKISNVTLSSVTIHNQGTTAGIILNPETGSYPDAQNNGGIANAYGIWARGVNGLTLKDCSFFDDGGSKRTAMYFDSSVQNVDTSQITSAAVTSKKKKASAAIAALHDAAAQLPRPEPR